MERETRLVMGMPVTVGIVDVCRADIVGRIFDYFTSVDARFSPFRADSEVALYGRGETGALELSTDMQEVLDLAALSKRQSHGYFEVWPDGSRFDPSGIVKGWAISKAAGRLRNEGIGNFFIDAGGDVQTAGRNEAGNAWRVGIRNPFNSREIVRSVQLSGEGIATSGTYARGAHIYDPRRPGTPPGGIVSVTVISDDVLEADRFATAAFAMGGDAVHFIEDMPETEAYVIDADGVATMTSGFKAFALP